MSEDLERQNDVIIALLARSVIGLPAIVKAVCEGKRNPEAYRKVYNGLDGSAGVTQIAKLAGVSQSTMSEVLASWEEQGVIYNAGSDSKPEYHRLLMLPPPKREKAKGGKDGK